MASGEATMADGVEIGVAAVEDRAVAVEEEEGDRGSTVWLMVTNNAQ